MTRSRSEIPQLADPSGFEVDIDDRSISGKDHEAWFNIEFEFGNLRDNGDVDDRFTHEPDVIHIDNIRAAEGRSLGTAALALAIPHFKESGFSVARMEIINPRVIGMVEKLHLLDVVHARYYRKLSGILPVEEPPTSLVPFVSDTITASEASAYMDAVAKAYNTLKAAGINPDGPDHPEANGGIDCTIFF